MVRFVWIVLFGLKQIIRSICAQDVQNVLVLLKQTELPIAVNAPRLKLHGESLMIINERRRDRANYIERQWQKNDTPAKLTPLLAVYFEFWEEGNHQFAETVWVPMARALLAANADPEAPCGRHSSFNSSMHEDVRSSVSVSLWSLWTCSQFLEMLEDFPTASRVAAYLSMPGLDVNRLVSERSRPYRQQMKKPPRLALNEACKGREDDYITTIRSILDAKADLLLDDGSGRSGYTSLVG